MGQICCSKTDSQNLVLDNDMKPLRRRKKPARVLVTDITDHEDNDQTSDLLDLQEPKRSYFNFCSHTPVDDPDTHSQKAPRPVIIMS